jgi:hypothetical protein
LGTNHDCEAGSDAALSKYDPLTAFVQRQPSDKDVIRMSFRRLEEIIGAPLPSPWVSVDRRAYPSTLSDLNDHDD